MITMIKRRPQEIGSCKVDINALEELCSSFFISML